MNKVIPLFLLLTSFKALSQSPEVMINEIDIQKHKIRALYVVLDTANKSFNLPIDTIIQIKFNSQGEKIFETSIRSDINYHFIKKIYSYNLDSVNIQIIDSAFGGPAFMRETDTSFITHKYKTDKLIQKKNYPSSSNRELEWTKNFEYNPNGYIQKVVTYHEPRQPNDSGFTSIVEYFYDEKTRLIKTIDKVFKPNSNDINYQFEVSYTYEENKQIKATHKEEFPGADFGEKWIEKDEIVSNETGQIIKIIEYGKKGEVWFITIFKYNESGLLMEEEGFKQGNVFAYRYKTYYQFKE